MTMKFIASNDFNRSVAGIQTLNLYNRSMAYSSWFEENIMVRTVIICTLVDLFRKIMDQRKALVLWKQISWDRTNFIQLKIWKTRSLSDHFVKYVSLPN